LNDVGLNAEAERRSDWPKLLNQLSDEQLDNLINLVLDLEEG
jgi:hypothetical protein